MNAENFGEYLKNPALLYQLSYEELKSLVLQYPFSANLHALLFQKSQIEGHKDLDINLIKAASHSIDRANLYKKASQESLLVVEREKLELENEILELKDLSDVEEALINLPLQNESDSEKTAVLDVPSFAFGEEADEEIKLPSAVSDASPTLSVSKSPSSFLADSDLIDTLVACSAAIENLFDKKKAKPVPKVKFSSWLKQKQKKGKIKEELDGLMEFKKIAEAKKKKKKKKKAVAKLAKKSISLNEDIASETLAGLLAKQGKISKAIAMYQRLSLIFPEKNSYFAAKIENLKKHK